MRRPRAGRRAPPRSRKTGRTCAGRESWDLPGWGAGTARFQGGPLRGFGSKYYTAGHGSFRGIIRIPPSGRVADEIPVRTDFEMLLQEFYSEVLQPGDVCADVGAHVGRHAGPM